MPTEREMQDARASAISALIPIMLFDGETRVRRASATSLGQLDGPLIPLVISTIFDRSPSVELAAAKALVKGVSRRLHMLLQRA